ncbi:MAG: hypothetical protein KAJ19_23590 [Gammaproteobacteria bacterium]|nr:hypothetical protein [Gammaproteobacteria bacterium]
MKIPAIIAIVLLTGCSGYKSALVPMDPPPVVTESEPVRNPYNFNAALPLPFDLENHKLRAITIDK